MPAKVTLPMYSPPLLFLSPFLSASLSHSLSVSVSLPSPGLAKPYPRPSYRLLSPACRDTSPSPRGGPATRAACRNRGILNPLKQPQRLDTLVPTSTRDLYGPRCRRPPLENFGHLNRLGFKPLFDSLPCASLCLSCLPTHTTLPQTSHPVT